MPFKLNPAFKRKLEELSKPRNVSLDELMPPAFMRANTKFQSIQEMFDKSEFAEAKEEEIKETFETEAWNAYVRSNTRFNDWKEMLSVAAAQEIKQRFNS